MKGAFNICLDIALHHLNSFQYLYIYGNVTDIDEKKNKKKLEKQKHTNP